MGLNFNMTRLLIDERARSKAFNNTATLGRQSMHVSGTRLQYSLNEYGFHSVDAHALISGNNGYCEPFLRVLGATTTDSIDVSDYERATILHEMNTPIPEALKQRFDTLIDSGSLEHIFNFPVAIKNCMEMVREGGRFISITPANNFFGHGFYQFSPELFFRVLSPENGFRVDRMIFFEDDYIARWYSVADPLEVRSRVEILNTTPSYLFVVASRVKVVPVFEQPPQQSDYQFQSWNESPVDAEPFKPNPILRYIPYGIKKAASSLIATGSKVKIAITGFDRKRKFFKRIK